MPHRPRSAGRAAPDLAGKGLARWGPSLAVLALVAAFTVLLVREQWLAFDALGTQWGHDLAFFDQIFFAASRGRAWASPLLLEPMGMLRMVHFHPVFGLLVPIYALAPGPRTLLVFNVLAVTLAAFPLARLGREVSGRPWFAPVAALAFLIWLPTVSAALNDFRPMALFVAGFAWLALGGWTGRWRPLLAGALLVLITREESAYLLAAGGLALSFRHRRQGFAVTGLGVAWYLFLLAFKDNLFFHFDPAAWVGGLGEGPPVAAELRQARGGFLLQTWLSGYLLAPAAPSLLGVALPPSLFLWLDPQREWQAVVGPYVHLRSAWLPLFAAAGTVGAALLVRRMGRLGWAVALVMVLGNALALPRERARLWTRHQALVEQLGSEEQAGLEGLIRQVGPEDRVCTDYRLIARLSGRRVLWNSVHLYLDEGRPPHWRWAWPVTLDRVDLVLLPVGDPVLGRIDEDWRLAEEAAGYQLWRRLNEPDGGFPDAIP